MRTGAIQADVLPEKGKENLYPSAGFIPPEAIRTSEAARNPMIKDENGKVLPAKTLFRRKGDPYGEDRISVEKTDIENETKPLADETVMPG